MFCLADSGGITAPLYDPATVPNPNLSNEEFLKEFVVNLLHTAFPHLQQYACPSFFFLFFSFFLFPFSLNNVFMLFI